MRGDKIATKIRITKDDGSMADYACTGHSTLSYNGYEYYKYQNSKWVKNGEEDTEVTEFLKQAFIDFAKESAGLYKRKMNDSKGEYYIMYRDTYIEDKDSEDTLSSDDWHMKVSDNYVVVNQKFNDNTKKYDYTYHKRAFGEPKDRLLSFTPTENELERIVNMIVIGDKIRQARRNEYSRTRSMVRNTAYRSYQTDSQRSFASCAKQERKLKQFGS